MLKKHVRQLADDIFTFTVDDDVKVTVVEGLRSERAHLRPAANSDDIRVELFG